MFDLTAILNIITLALLAFGTRAVVLLKVGTEAAVKTTAEEAAKAAIRQLQWPAELGRELQKTRGVERQELRFKSYGVLWKALRPLAIYDETAVNRKTVRELASALSDWYFSECGGLLLTPQARDFYFALQDLLRATSRFHEDWHADRSAASEGDQRVIFRRVLEARRANEATAVLDYLRGGAFDSWQDEAPRHAKAWKQGLNLVAASWKELDRTERFAALQQAGSVLRTSLTIDLDSRMR